MYLSKIKVSGFWARATAETPLNRSVNILIGLNGSGKTTLVNILHAALTADPVGLGAAEFKEIHLSFETAGGDTRTVTITRDTEDGAMGMVFYSFDGGEPLRLPVGEPFRPRTRERLRILAMSSQQWEEVRARLTELVSVRWISVHRYALSDIRSESEDGVTVLESPVDARIRALLAQFSRYQASLDSAARERSADFRRGLAYTMLYNEDYDRSSAWSGPLGPAPAATQRTALHKALHELGIPRTDAQSLVTKHIEAVNRSVETLLAYTREPSAKGLEIDDILPLPLLRRTERIVQLVNDVEEATRLIYRQRELFRTLVNGFLQEPKRISFSPTGEIVVESEAGPLPIFRLSSGEKQLLILLIEALLEEEKPCIFIADEPELSLHVEWQQKLLSALVQLNQNAQIIVATHSPEIVADFHRSVLRMQDVIHG